MKKEKSERASVRKKKSEKKWERQEGDKENLLKIDRGDKRQKVEGETRGKGQQRARRDKRKNEKIGQRKEKEGNTVRVGKKGKRKRKERRREKKY